MADALVVSGGGSKGAFSVGVVDHILKNGIVGKFSAISGTSTGALMAPLIALGEIETLKLIYTTTTTDMIISKFNVGMHNILKGENHFFGTEPLLRLVKRTYAPRWNSIQALDTPLFFSSINMQKGTIEAYTTLQDDALIKEMNSQFKANNENRSVIRIRNLEDFIFSIMASSNQPVFMPPINVQHDLNQISQNVDGGAREYVPIRIILELDKAAHKLGKTNVLPARLNDIYACSNNPHEVKPEFIEFSNLIDMLKRTIHVFQADVTLNDIETIRRIANGVRFLNKIRDNLINQHGLAAEQVDELFNIPENPFKGIQNMKLHVFQPRESLGSDGGLEFERNKMHSMMLKGVQVAKDYFNSPEPIDFIV